MAEPDAGLGGPAEETGPGSTDLDSRGPAPGRHADDLPRAVPAD